MTSLDEVYFERNSLVALLARQALAEGRKAGVAEDAAAPGPWKVVLVDLPTGQVSWHVHEDDLARLPALPPYDGVWDGHNDAEKWARVNASHRPAEVCGAMCDHGSECLELAGHDGAHDTQHGCRFYGETPLDRLNRQITTLERLQDGGDLLFSGRLVLRELLDERRAMLKALP